MMKKNGMMKKMNEEKEMEILTYLAQDNVFEFLVKFKTLQEEYNKMKKVYDKKIRDILKEIADGEKIIAENDVFRVAISQPQETTKLISIIKARKLPQEIKDLILEDKMTSASMRVTLIEDETEEF